MSIYNKHLSPTSEFVIMRRLLESPRGRGLVARVTNAATRGLEVLAPGTGLYLCGNLRLI